MFGLLPQASTWDTSPLGRLEATAFRTEGNEIYMVLFRFSSPLTQAFLLNGNKNNHLLGHVLAILFAAYSLHQVSQFIGYILL